MSNQKHHHAGDKSNHLRSKVSARASSAAPSPQKPLLLDSVQEAISTRPELISKLNSNLWTWLHRAAYQGKADIVEYLLTLNYKYAESLIGVTTHSLATSGLCEHASHVLPVNQQDVFGRTALHVAVSYGTTECVQAMLDYNNRMTKLFSEQLPKASPELMLLLSFDLDLVNAKGQTPILCSVRRGDSAILNMLLQASADPNVADDHKLACLQMVCARMDPNSVFSETTNANTGTSSPGPKPTSMVPSPSTSQILYRPAQVIDTPEFTKLLSEQAKLLIQKGADLSLLDLHQENVLHYACRRADIELLQTLLHNGKLYQSHSLLAALRSLYLDGRLPGSIAARLECCDLLNSAYLALIHKEVESKGIAKLTTSEVCEWLVSIGLQGSRELFLKNQVTGAFLEQVSDETIKKDLGLETLGQRSTFINRLQELKDIDKRRAQRALVETFPGSPDANRDPSEEDDSVLLGLPNAKDFEIQMDDLVIGDVIGRGNFGEVRRGQWKDVLVAIKTIYRTGGDTAKKDVYREMGILAQLRHPNILGFLGYVKQGGSVMMVTDLMTGGSLHNFIKFSFETVTRLRFKLVAGIARGMVYLHHRKLVHRDLNTKNLLLDDHYGIKISDFGLSRPKNDHKMTMTVGFLGGMAPEVYKGNDYTEKADVFSFAMAVYEIVTGKESHHAQSNVMMYAHEMATHNYRPPLDDLETPADWNNLIRKCWATDPQERPSFSELLEELHNMEQSSARAAPVIPVSLTESGAYVT